MGLILYNILRPFYIFLIRVYALFDGKAKKWVAGRKDWEAHISATLKPGEKRIWIHCSSVGEFEQAKPLIVALKGKYPDHKIVVTFFSPSGYEASQKNTDVDHIFYLPADTNRNAEKFVSIVSPSLVLFIKYEFWYYYLLQLKRKNIPTILVSGAFRESQPFFKWYGKFFRDMLRCFSFFFLQDETSKKLLHSIGIDKNVLVSGDTRYDRVSVIAQNITPIEAIEKFKGAHKILIAGSAWPGDEEVIKEGLPILPENWKLIIAPHEIDDDHIQKLRQLLGYESVLFSELDAENTGKDKKILIINNIGMLSRLFAYGDLAFIGGGFQKGGIHNILEPAVFGVPVLFGPIYEKFVEAKELADLHYVFPVRNAMESNEILKKLIADEAYRSSVSEALKQFMTTRRGATDIIMEGIKREKWLS